MSGLSLQVYADPTRETMLADWTQRLSGALPVMNNEHGYGSLSGFVPMDIDEAFRFYNADAIPHIVLSDGAFRAFEGRIEDTAITSQGLRFTALGYWRAYSDTLYTELWSDDSVGGWEWVKDTTLTVSSAIKPMTSVYQWGKDDELFMTVRKGERAQGFQAAMFRYTIPDKSTREIVRLTFDYEVNLFGTTPDWVLAASLRNADMSLISETWSISATSGTASIALDFSGTPCPVVTFEFRADVTTGTFWDYTETTGKRFAHITNIRVKTFDAATVDSSEIVEDVVANVNGINSNQVATTTGLIDSPGVDLFNEVYKDQHPAEILTKLASLGDDQTPPNVYEVGVWEDRTLHYRQRGSAGRTWAITISDLNIKRTIENLGNEAYTRYRAASGVDQRTSVSTDDSSVLLYDLTRQVFTDASTNDATEASVYRDSLLNDMATPKPDTGITVARITDEFGAVYPAHFVRSGDTAVIQNLPPTAGSEIDRIRRFIIHRVEYDPTTNLITIIPERDLPTLPVLVARNSEGL